MIFCQSHFIIINICSPLNHSSLSQCSFLDIDSRAPSALRAWLQRTQACALRVVHPRSSWTTPRCFVGRVTQSALAARAQVTFSASLPPPPPHTHAHIQHLRMQSFLIYFLLMAQERISAQHARTFFSAAAAWPPARREPLPTPPVCALPATLCATPPPAARGLGRRSVARAPGRWTAPRAWGRAPWESTLTPLACVACAPRCAATAVAGPPPWTAPTARCWRACRPVAANA